MEKIKEIKGLKITLKDRIGKLYSDILIEYDNYNGSTCQYDLARCKDFISEIDSYDEIDLEAFIEDDLEPLLAHLKDANGDYKHRKENGELTEFEKYSEEE